MRRTIRIEITDVSDEDADLFYGPKHRETATLVREFVLGDDENPPAELVGKLAAWLDGRLPSGIRLPKDIPPHEHQWADIHCVMACTTCRIPCPDCDGAGCGTCGG